MVIGIVPGESREAQAGATRQVVSLAVDPSGSTAVIGDRRVAISDDILVLWHQGDAGTFHGIADAVELRSRKVRAGEDLTPADIRGVVLRSDSGAAAIAAAVVKVDRPMAVVTSGYQGRSGWRLRVYEPGVGLVFDGAPADYRALHAPVESL